MAAPVLDSVYPADNAVGVVLSDVVYVVFDQEVDSSTVELVVEGPDTDMWSGPDLGRWDDPETTEDNDVLANPGYTGLVPGTFSFEKAGGAATAEVSTITLPTLVSTTDGDYVVLHDPVNTSPDEQWAVALDTTGAAAQTPTGAVWVTVPAAQRVYTDVSSTSTDEEMAAAVLSAFNGLAGFSAQFALIDNEDGTLTATAGNTGPCTDVEVHSFDDGGAGSITAAVDTAGADELFDTAGDGGLWMTKAVFTPDQPLKANTTYRAYIVGDEESADDIHSGVSSRTVFDTLPDGGNTGSGEVFFSGGYSGPTTDSVNVRVLETGLPGDRLTFEWWRGSSPLLVSQLTTRESSQPLTAGVSVRFAGTSFDANDEFSVVVKPAEYMEDTFAWDFETGSGSIQTVPTGVQGAVSQSIIPLGSSLPIETASFRVVSVDPEERATNQPLNTDTITIEFSDDVDPATINDNTVRVWTEPVNGDPSIEAEGDLGTVMITDGETLTIQIG